MMKKSFKFLAAAALIATAASCASIEKMAQMAENVKVTCDPGVLECVNGDIDAAISPERNNSGFTSYSKDINNISSATGTSCLMLCLYKLGSSKQVGYANVCITGEIKKETTGVAEVDFVSSPMDNTIYNLQGQKVDHPHKGIYIINHQKIVVK